MSPNNYINFSDTREFARSLMLKSRGKWEEWVASNTLPPGIPRHPEVSIQEKDGLAGVTF